MLSEPSIEEICAELGIEPLTPEQVAARRAYVEASNAEIARIVAYRDALASARSLLLQYGTPEGLTYPETFAVVQQAVLAYRDSGIDDHECNTHIMWINARVNEINAAALFASGVLE